MSVNVGTAVGYLDLDTSRWNAGFTSARRQLSTTMDAAQSAGTRFQATGSLMSQVGGTLTKAITLPFVGLGVAAVKSSIDTESSMAKVNSILRLGGKEFDTYKNTIKDGANDIGLAYNTYADAAYEAISAGVKQADVTTFLSGANKLAKGGLTDLTQATNLLTTVQNAYGLSQKDMAHVSDVLIQTQNKGKVTVDELASSMGRIIPTAKGLGVSVDQLGAGYAIMTAKGIASTEATTYMNSMFNELGKSGTKVDTILKEVSGKSFKGLMEEGKSTGDVLQILSDYAEQSGLSLTDLFGSAEAGKAALTLLNEGSSEFNDMLKTMEDSAGSTDRAFKEMEKTAKDKLAQAMGKLKNALSDLGDALMPVVTEVAEAAAKFAEWASSMARNNPELTQLVVGILGVIAIVGPLLMALGSMFKGIEFLLLGFGKLKDAFILFGKGIGKLKTGFLILKSLLMDTLIPAFEGLFTIMLANPIILIVAAIAVLIGAFIYLWNTNDKFKQFWIDMWNQVKDFCSNAIEAIKLKFTEWGTAITEFVTTTIPQFIEGIATWFSQLPTVIGTWLTTAWTDITTWCSDTWNTFITWCTNVITSVGEWFSQLPYKIGFALGEALGNIVKWGLDTWTYLTTNVPLWIEAVVKFFSELPGKIWQWLVSAFEKVTTWGSQMLQKAIEVGTNFLNKTVEFFTQLPGKIWSFLSNAYSKAVTWGSQMVAKAVEAGSQFISRVSSFLQQLPGQVWGFLSQAISKAASFVIQFAQKGMDAAKKFGSNVMDGLKALPGQVVSVGTNIVQGLWNGISGAAGWLYGQVKSFATGILDGMKSALGIHSPSRKARDLVGVFIPQGIWQGVAQEMPKLQRNLDNSLSNLFDTRSLESSNIGNSFVDKVSQGLEGLGLIGDKLKTDMRSTADSIISDLKRINESFSNVENLRVEALYSNLQDLVQSHEFAVKTLVNEPKNVDKSVKVEIDYAKLAKTIADNSKANVNIENTYNSPKPASIKELKQQDKIQMRRLAMQLR